MRSKIVQLLHGIGCENVTNGKRPGNIGPAENEFHFFWETRRTKKIVRLLVLPFSMISSVNDGDTPNTDIQTPSLLQSSLQLSNALMPTDTDSHPTLFQSASNDHLNGTTVSYSTPLLTRTLLADLQCLSICFI